MKIGIISDSHDHKNKIIKAVECFNDEKVEKVIHAGDIVSPFTKQEFGKLNCEMIAVFGNNDGEKLGLKNVFDIDRPPRKLILNKKKCLILHEPFNLNELKKSNNYDLIIYGHLHVPKIRKGETLVINPGETCCWLTDKATIVILDTETMEPRLIEL